MSREKFGTMPDGTLVERVRLSGYGLIANIITYGGVVQDLRLDGHDVSLVLGFEEFDPYLSHSPYFGATAGRCANRIGGGHLEIDGKTYQLDQNFLGRHCLHGGSLGAGKRVWKIEEHTKSSITLSIVLADEEMGFPGKLTTRMVYSLQPDATLDIQFYARTDKPTVCNFCHHSYFNLDGAETILDHVLQVAAVEFTPTDAELVPTGAVQPVRGTGLDFTEPQRVGSSGNNELLDYNLCLSNTRQPLRHVATLSSPASGVSMAINTTETGLQVYDGAKIDVPVNGLNGVRMSQHAGIALEPQFWPDAVNHLGFPDAILRPDEEYFQHTQYAFNKVKA